MNTIIKVGAYVSVAAMFSATFAAIWTLDWRWAASAIVFVCLVVFFGVMGHGDDPS